MLQNVAKLCRFVPNLGTFSDSSPMLVSHFSTGIRRQLISRLLIRHGRSLKPAEIKIKAFVPHPRVSSVGKSVRLYL